MSLVISAIMKDGEKRYFKESYPHHQQSLVFVKDFDDALRYNLIDEFKASWNLFPIKKDYLEQQPQEYYREDVEKLFAFDLSKCIKTEIPLELTKESCFVKKVQKKTFDLEPNYFEKLLTSYYVGENSVYDKNGNWLTNKKDFKKAWKIKYKKEGINSIFYHIFAYRNKESNGLPIYYEKFYSEKLFLVFDSIMLDIFLSDIETEEFIEFRKKDCTHK